MLKHLSFRPVRIPGIMDLAAIIYAILALILSFGAYLMRDSIINDELYDRFRENINRFSNSTDLNWPLIFAESIKFFSYCAYDILVIMYLIKPLRSPTSEVFHLYNRKETLANSTTRRF